MNLSLKTIETEEGTYFAFVDLSDFIADEDFILGEFDTLEDAEHAFEIYMGNMEIDTDE